ncbi:MAG: SDR family NAD(P)-dependent oxidoreductase [Thermoanaerobaculia bacterium]
MSGPVTLVTGASSGIGRELALVAAEESRAVVLAARREGRLEELAGRIRGLPGAPEAVVVPADLATREGREAFLEELAALEARGLAIDHLVNNAGLGHDGPFHENDAGREATTVAVNVVALHELSRALLPAMVERGYGRVLNVASAAAYQPLPYMATYAATKAFVLSLSEALWREYRGTGVTVTCLAPGRTSTEFFDGAGMEGIAFMKMPAASAPRVARAGYRGMKEGKRVVIPGFQNRLTAWLASRLPRRPVLAIAAALFAPRGSGTR